MYAARLCVSICAIAVFELCLVLLGLLSYCSSLALHGIGPQRPSSPAAWRVPPLAVDGAGLVANTGGTRPSRCRGN